MSTTTYYASRSSATSRTDEDMAMSSVDIYEGDDLHAAQQALATYMEREATYLESQGREWATERAALIRNHVQEATYLTPPLTGDYTRVHIEVADTGLRYRIVRVTR